MPLTGEGLFEAMKANLPTPANAAIQEAALKPMCDAIIDYIKENGSVSVNVPALGLNAPNGPVTGSASGSGTIS